MQDFEHREDAEALLPDLERYGLKGLYIVVPRKKIIPVKKITGVPAAKVQKVAVQKTRNIAGKIIETTKPDVTYFAVIVGYAADEAGAKREQEQVLKILRYTSFPIKEDGAYKLIVTGFTGRKFAEIFHKKLIEIGVREGYIRSYKKSLATITSVRGSGK